MDHNEFLRLFIHTILEPATTYGVSSANIKGILADTISTCYVPKSAITRVMLEEGFACRFDEHNPTFKAKLRCRNVFASHYSREFIIRNFGRREFERWDSVNDAIVVLKHMLVNSHNRFNEDIDTVVAEVLSRHEREIFEARHNDEPREIPEEAQPSR